MTVCCIHYKIYTFNGTRVQQEIKVFSVKPLGYNDDFIHPECIPSLEEQIEYVGQSHWLLLVNEERVNPEGFNEEAIERFSIIYNQ